MKRKKIGVVFILFFIPFLCLSAQDKIMSREELRKEIRPVPGTAVLRMDDWTVWGVVWCKLMTGPAICCSHDGLKVEPGYPILKLPWLSQIAQWGRTTLKKPYCQDGQEITGMPR